MTTSRLSQYRALTQTDRPAFAEACAHARAGFSDAIDLLLIHNEREVRGNQPRTALNPLTVLLSVAAWERFVVDLKAICLGRFTGAGKYDEYERRWHGANKGAKGATALVVLGAASGGRLPDQWSVRTFSGWRGKTPTGSYQLSGANQRVLTGEIDTWINLRNKVAHWCLPQDDQATAGWESDADTATIQSGEARITLSLFVQLVDQAIVAISDASGLSEAGRLRLPAEWFAATPPAGFRRLETPGVLWDGQPLPR